MESEKQTTRVTAYPEVGAIFYTATFFALVAGFGELAVFGFQKFVLHHYIHQNLDAIWMAPLASVLFFLLVALVIWIVARWLPRMMSGWLPVFVLAFLCAVCLLVMATWVQWIPLVILALGLAAETTRLIGDHPAGFNALVRGTVGWVGWLKWARKTAPPVDAPSARASDTRLTRREFFVSTGTVLAGLAVSARGPRILGEQIARAQLPAAPHGAPNVLLITLDTVRAQSTSLSGYDRPTTPNLERLAKKGVWFERAISTAPWTLPSHASLFTGRFPHELSADRKTPLDGSFPTLAEVLAARGYVTDGFVANIEYCTIESGLGRGFIKYEDYEVSLESLASAWSLGNFLSLRPKLHQLVNNWNYLARKNASQVNAEFLRGLDQLGSRPFFAFLNYFDAHAPYYPPQPFDGMFGPTTPRDAPLSEKWIHTRDIPLEVLQAEINAYDGTIAYIDHAVGALMDELERRGVLENTVVIITSDHGEEFGEHDVFSHGQSLYLSALHVPLLIQFPGRVPAGRRVKAAVSLRDVAATVMDLTHLENKATFPGESLARYWNGSLPPKPLGGAGVLSELKYAGGFPQWFPISRGNMQSLAFRDYHYIKNGDGQEELYNWHDDPMEQANLAGSDHGRSKLVHFRNWLKGVVSTS